MANFYDSSLVQLKSPPGICSVAFSTAPMLIKNQFVIVEHEKWYIINSTNFPSFVHFFPAISKLRSNTFSRFNINRTRYVHALSVHTSQGSETVVKRDSSDYFSKITSHERGNLFRLAKILWLPRIARLFINCKMWYFAAKLQFAALI